MAIVKNIYVDQNSNWEKTFTLYDQNHSPFNLSGYTPYAQIRKYPQTDVIAEFSCEVLNPPTLGKLVLSLDYDTVSEIKEGKYLYDILLVASDNIQIRAVEGTVEISGNITE